MVSNCCVTENIRPWIINASGNVHRVFGRIKYQFKLLSVDNLYFPLQKIAAQ